MKCHPPSSYSADAACRAASRVEASQPTADPDIASRAERSKRTPEISCARSNPSRCSRVLSNCGCTLYAPQNFVCTSVLSITTSNLAAHPVELLENLFL